MRRGIGSAYALVLLCLVPPVRLSAADHAPATFPPSPIVDGIALGAGLLLDAGLFAADEIQGRDGPVLVSPDVGSLNAIDRVCVFGYSPSLDFASDILAGGAVVFPAVLLAAPESEWLGLGLAYAECLAWAWGLKELGKEAFRRCRPYGYAAGGPPAGIDPGEWAESFPSGHAALSFASAGFCAVTIWRLMPDSPLKVPAMAACYCLAVGASALRVASGSHFPTDVLVGAAIGSLVGIAVPLLHATKPRRPSPDGKVSIAIASGALACALRY